MGRTERGSVQVGYRTVASGRQTLTSAPLAVASSSVIAGGGGRRAAAG